MKVVKCRLGVFWKCVSLDGGIQLDECLTADASMKARRSDNKKEMDLKLPPVCVHLAVIVSGNWIDIMRPLALVEAGLGSLSPSCKF